jgi:tRNA(adenine34) deaminase
MCAGALVHARVSRIVIATKEPRAGAGGSVLNVLQHDQLNHRCDVEFGLMQQQSEAMLKAFFRARRKLDS